MATYKVRHEGKEYSVEVKDRAGGGATVTVEGRSFDVEPALLASATTARAPQTTPVAAAVAPVPQAPATRVEPPRVEPGGRGDVHAPIPGVITKVCVKPGDHVEAGQILLKLEAMKMENDIYSPVAGTVKEVAVAAGAEVRDGQLMVVVG
jgi:biotin carboxyl carrier protein